MKIGKGIMVSVMILLNCTTLAMAAPSFSDNSTSSTQAGQPTLFSLNISDAGGLGGYIFSTNNTGLWVNDSLVSFNSTVPWNSWNNEGTLLEGFDNSSEWEKYGDSDFVMFDDTSGYVEGSGSISIWTDFQQTLAIRRVINLNLSNASNFYFWFYTSNVMDLDHTSYPDSVETNPAISLYFASNSSALDEDTTYFSCSVFGSELKTGWNKIVLSKNSCWTNSSIPESWENTMTSMQMRVYLKDPSTNTSISFDNLRYDYAGGLLDKAVVIMTFDDGWSTTFSTVYPIMQSNGQRGVSFVNIEPIIGEWDTYMHIGELTTLYNNGWDISSHSWSHAHLNSSLSPAELELEIVKIKEWLDNNSFIKSSGFFAYPYHEYDDTVLSYVNSTYKLARNDFGADSQPHIHLGDPDNIPFLMKATEIMNTTTANYINSVVDRAIAQKGLLILSFHKINETATEETVWTTSDFQNVSDYIKIKTDEGRLDVMTFSEYYSAISNTPTTAWSNVTKTLNSTVGTTIEWCVYAKNVSDSWSSSCVSPFSLVTTAAGPFWSDAQYDAVSDYSPEPFKFNITWNSSVGIDSVLIAITNSTDVLINNSSMNLISGDEYLGVYSYNASLPAGTFSWTSYANDTLGRNATDSLAFTINKASNPTNLYFNNGTEYENQNIDIVYSTPINVTGICTAGDCNLYRNDTGISENNTEVILGVGVWRYLLVSSGNQNYSTNFSEEYNITVTKGVLKLSIQINPSDSVVIHTPVTVIGIDNNIGDENVVYELRRDGVLVDNMNDVFSPSAVGTYNYTFNATGNENWTDNTVGIWRLLTVQPPSNSFSGGGVGGVYVPPVQTNNTTNTSSTGDVGGEWTDTAANDSQDETCIEEWSCSLWSECINNTQTRTCIDINECGTEINKSSEVQECEPETLITGLFSFLSTPLGFGAMAFIAMMIIFIALPLREKLNKNKLALKKAKTEPILGKIKVSTAPAKRAKRKRKR